MTALTQALFYICQEEQSTTSVELIRNAAFEKLSSGESKSLINTSLNGKSFSYNISKAADVLFTEASEAIRLYNNGIISVTQMDFSAI